MRRRGLVVACRTQAHVGEQCPGVFGRAPARGLRGRQPFGVDGEIGAQRGAIFEQHLDGVGPLPHLGCRHRSQHLDRGLRRRDGRQRRKQVAVEHRCAEIGTVEVGRGDARAAEVAGRADVHLADRRARRQVGSERRRQQLPGAARQRQQARIAPRLLQRPGVDHDAGDPPPRQQRRAEQADRAAADDDRLSRRAAHEAARASGCRAADADSSASSEPSSAGVPTLCQRPR